MRLGFDASITQRTERPQDSFTNPGAIEMVSTRGFEPLTPRRSERPRAQEAGSRILRPMSLDGEARPKSSPPTAVPLGIEREYTEHQSP
jgi:hypothetical protein